MIEIDPTFIPKVIRKLNGPTTMVDGAFEVFELVQKKKFGCLPDVVLEIFLHSMDVLHVVLVVGMASCTKSYQTLLLFLGVIQKVN